MQEIMSERNPRLPVIRIDAYAAKHLKLSLETARTVVRNGVVFKDKKSKKLPVEQLPTESTNPSDSFKYLVMTKQLRGVASGKTMLPSSATDPRAVGKNKDLAGRAPYITLGKESQLRFFRCAARALLRPKKCVFAATGCKALNHLILTGIYSQNKPVWLK